ncbi:13739_t:CDS:2, partial [Dentiscutata erythropus]
DGKLALTSQEQCCDNQEFMHSAHKQPDNDEFDSANETDDFTIKDSAEFPSWKSLENILKKYEAEIGFKAIKFRMERNNTGVINRRYFVCENSKECQSKKKIVSEDQRDRESKKKEFAPSLRMLSQEVLDEIKFLTHIQSVFFEPVQNAIKKYLTLESASMQNAQISQSVLYRVYLYEVSNNSTLFPNAHEYAEGYLEDEYNALQASLKNIINMVNRDNILEVWRVSLFDRHNYSYSHYVILLKNNTYLCTDAANIMEFDTNEEMNQVIAIRGPNTYQASIHACVTQKQEYTHGFGIAKSGLKFALENGLINEF